MTARFRGTSPFQCTARVVANSFVSTGLIRLDAELDRDLEFLPGQFAMLNLQGGAALVFSRPFSIFNVEARTVSFLYRIVGRGTGLMAGLTEGDALTFLGPLGRPFPAPAAEETAILVAGGVGLPPVAAWLKRYGRTGDLAFFGARDGHDLPWDLLAAPWEFSLDDLAGLPAGRAARLGLVTELVGERLEEIQNGEWTFYACGPLPLLAAVSKLASGQGRPCWISLEEHMGCGYGACKGCVVPVRQDLASGDSETGWRHATSCQEGPVFRADTIDWQRFLDPGTVE